MTQCQKNKISQSAHNTYYPQTLHLQTSRKVLQKPEYLFLYLTESETVSLEYANLIKDYACEDIFRHNDSNNCSYISFRISTQRNCLKGIPHTYPVLRRPEFYLSNH